MRAQLNSEPSPARRPQISAGVAGGVQYALFRGVSVTRVGQPVTLTIRPGVDGYAVIPEIQVAASSATPALRSVDVITPTLLLANNHPRLQFSRALSQYLPHQTGLDIRGDCIMISKRLQPIP